MRGVAKALCFALHCIILGNGWVKLAVHSADVTLLM